MEVKGLLKGGPRYFLLVDFTFALVTGNLASVHPFHPPRRAAVFLTP